MNKHQSSVDGFVPRRRIHTEKDLGQTRASGVAHVNNIRIAKENNPTVGNDEALQETLKSLDAPDLNDNQSLPKAHFGRRQRNVGSAKASGHKRKIVKWTIIVLVLIIVGVGGFLAYRLLRAGGNVLQGNMIDLIRKDKLKTDSAGRTNILVYGTSPADHDGANLTDSMMILSINQSSKDAYVVSVPRDLWVKYETNCSAGYEGKINAVYMCASDDGKNESSGSAALESKIGEIFGVTFQYYVHVKWDALTRAVDAVGGIDVTIQSSDPRGVLDRNFDWMCNYKCYYVKYANNQTVHLDGIHALALARARGASGGGYGFSEGNFDREKDQQMILKALKTKATSVGTITNIGKITSLIDAMGDNLKTDIQTSEIRTFADVVSGIDNSKIHSLTLIDTKNPLVTTGNISGQSVVEPVAGLFDYSGIRAYIKKNSIFNAVTQEGAKVAIYNGSGITGLASKEKTKLEDEGYTISYVGDAPTSDYTTNTVYEITTSKTETAKALGKIYGSSALTTEAPSFTVNGNYDFVIVLSGDGSSSPSGE